MATLVVVGPAESVPVPDPCHYVPNLNQMEASKSLCIHEKYSQVIRLRFHGMEEVVSSNLTRSTKFLKDLQKQNGPNALFGVRMESKNGRQRRRCRERTCALIARSILF